MMTILQQLDAIEIEMKKIGYWSASPPDLQLQIEAGEIKSYLDVPSFELWLQCIFIPNARTAAKNDSLPSQSDVGLMAMRQYDYHSIIEKALPLVSLLQEFDHLINKSSQ